MQDRRRAELEAGRVQEEEPQAVGLTQPPRRQMQRRPVRVRRLEAHEARAGGDSRCARGGVRRERGKRQRATVFRGLGRALEETQRIGRVQRQVLTARERGDHPRAFDGRLEDAARYDDGRFGSGLD